VQLYREAAALENGREPLAVMDEHRVLYSERR